jgi:hypothetical protein
MTDNVLTCPVCQASNPADHRCCKECGARLNSESQALAEQVLTILKRELRDQKVVELETSQAILERVSGWAKLLGFFVAIPLAILLATLTIWGVTKFTDFNAKVDQAQADVNKKLSAAGSKADQLATTSTQLETQYQQLRENAQRYEALGKEVQSLRTDVSKLQEKIGVTPGSAVTTQQRAAILNQLSRFQRYFQRLGYTAPAGELKVDVRDQSTMSAGTLAYFDPQTHTAVISKQVAGDISVVLREYTHSVLYSKVSNQPAPESNAPPYGAAYYAIESGLASYFPASFLGDPKNPVWDLSADRSWNPNSGYPENQAPAAAMFWAARSQVTDKDAFDRKLLQAWFDVAAKNMDAKFPAIFVDRLVALLGPVDGPKVKQVFASRGLPL